MGNIKNIFLNADISSNTHKSIQPILNKLKSIILRQYNCELEYYSYIDLKKKYIAPLIKKLANNEIEVQEGTCLFPMFVGQEFVGAAEVTSQLPLSEKVFNRISDITKTIIESALVDLDRLALIKQLENHLEFISESQNLIRIDKSIKNKEYFRQQNKDYYEINVPCLIQGDSLEDIFKLTLDIHSQTHRYAILPLSQIDHHQTIDAEYIKTLGPVTIFIPNVTLLNKTQISALNNYLEFKISKDQPMIIAGITTTLHQAIEHMGEELYKKISVSFIQLEKGYDFYSDKPILDLLLKQAQIDFSPNEGHPIN